VSSRGRCSGFERRPGHGHASVLGAGPLTGHVARAALRVRSSAARPGLRPQRVPARRAPWGRGARRRVALSRAVLARVGIAIQTPPLRASVPMLRPPAEVVAGGWVVGGRRGSRDSRGEPRSPRPRRDGVLRRAQGRGLDRIAVVEASTHRDNAAVRTRSPCAKRWHALRPEAGACGEPGARRTDTSTIAGEGPRPEHGSVYPARPRPVAPPRERRATSAAAPGTR